MNHIEGIDKIFRILSVSARVRIVHLLKTRSLCVNALAHELGISAAAVSQHLRILRTADVVTAEKKGYYVHYRVNDMTLARWRKVIDRFLAVTGNKPVAARRPVKTRKRGT
jgi:DNA-binding transcriptional ArsR family regulator